MTSEADQVYDGRRDIERAVIELAERLPDRLAPLARLACNYRWSWLEGAGALFAAVDPARWERSSHNPRWLLEAVPPRRLRQLAEQTDFVGRVEECTARFDAEMSPPRATGRITADRPLAYFCSEFGMHCSLPLYGGGLGILAGDILKAASDMALPFVGIGLLYRQGYFHQQLDTSGWQREYWTTTDFEHLAAVLVSGPNGDPLTVELTLRDRTVRLQLWRVDVGRVRLYLLDADRPDNHPIDRWITSRLYIGDRDTRLAQYAVLGIGGVRALTRLGIRPSFVHLNEGHAALSSLERIRQQLVRGLSMSDALAAIRAETAFTTHTPVPAGNEAYRPEEIEPVLGGFIDSFGLPRQSFYDLGRVQPGMPEEPLNLTALALRTSGAANAVSSRHGEVARMMWAPLWPERDADAVPITHVTNGVHTSTWMSGAMQELLDQHLDPRWRTEPSNAALWAAIDAIPDEELWRVRCRLRQTLVDYVRDQSIRDRLSRGEPLDYVEAAARVFDPTVLTIGFARRVATYKRLYLLGRQPERGLFRLLGDGKPPIQLVLAGKAHPQDHLAKEALRDGFQHKREQVVARQVIFLEDYDLHMAPRLVAGVDLWLNLPRPPLEASGTSGMKVVLNGGLNLSVLDGWWAEAYDGENGWAIDSVETDPRTQDDRDALALFDLLAHQVIPLFYERGADGLPHRWIERVKRSMRTLSPMFSAERMLRGYLETLYPRLGGISPG